MKLFNCNNCNSSLYFENDVCLHCSHSVGFDANVLSLITLNKLGDAIYADVKAPTSVFKYCINARSGTCNWLIELDQPSPYCIACDLNRVIPNLGGHENISKWKNIEVAKHRLIYSLLRLKLPVVKKTGNSEEGIAFDFLEDMPAGEKIMTGHDNGTITLNIDEASEPDRVKSKIELGERYRTLLGHFRHEIGHYYWDALIKSTSSLPDVRKLFGNDDLDYTEALKKYYQIGAPRDWMDHFISPYASSHPWEDWAETWAHYLHLMDTLETAFSFGIHIGTETPTDQKGSDAMFRHDPYEMTDFNDIIKSWLPLAFALNSLNRSMGHADFYPFVISQRVIDKLRFIHELCLHRRIK